MGILNLFRKKKKELPETELREEISFEEVMAEEVEKKPINLSAPEERKSYIKENCEQVIESTRQMEEAKVEYQAVTSYLTDMQKIDAIPMEDREEIDDAARKIITLTRERTKYQHQRNIKITDVQYKHMEKYERDILSEISKMKKNEDYNMIIKNDMRNLEGEKGALHYQKEEAIRQQDYLKGIAIVTSVIVGALFLLFLVIANLFDKDMTIPYVLTIIMAAVSATYILFESRKNIYEVKLTEKKLDRAITLLNKVKIKYINTTSCLDYSYSKYMVNNSNELSFLWEQYIKVKDEEKRYKDNTDLLNFYNERLIEQLKEFQISDAEIWIYQALAILDNKEMVEVRHRLNVRRQKLRERIDYNTKLLEGGLKEIQTVISEKPELKSEVMDMAMKYHIPV